MRLSDFLMLVAICVAWALSNVLGKIVVSHWGVPPIFFTAARFALVANLTFPWLLPMPRPAWRLIAIALLMGGGNFALLYLGLQTASPSAAAVVLQLGVPFTTLLAVMTLGERLHWRRWVGIALTLSGVLLISWQPGGFMVSSGLLFIAAAAFSGSLGAVLMKRADDVPPLKFQAWVGLVSAVTLGLASAIGESGQIASALEAGWRFLGAVVFTAVVVSIGAHTAYYRLIHRYEANLLAPLTLMTPLATIAFGVLLTGDRLEPKMIIGAAITLAGVLVVALRPRPATGLLLEREQR